MTWGCYRVKRDPPGKNPSRASSISACEHFFDCIWSVLLTYDARYLSSYSLGIGTVQMAISLNLIFNTWRIVRDWCLSENFLPQHLHNQPIFLFWLFALSLIKRQWKILVDGSNVVSSPPPLSTDKSIIPESVVSAETVVPCNSWGLLFFKRIDMDEPAQCCCCSLCCCGSKCCSMLQLYIGSALDAAKVLN